jgi:arylsulfatase A-like enzyme
MKHLAGRKCNAALSLINIYPTLVEISGLPAKTGLDGSSLVPLMIDPGAQWEKPALTTWGKGNYAIRTEKWRYIRYFDGTGELYDHQSDPNEWTNLVGMKKFDAVKGSLEKWFPVTEAKLQPQGTLNPVNADQPDLEKFKKLWKSLKLDATN